MFCIYADPLPHVQTRALALPKEHEMLPKDKYTTFAAKSVGYRKGVHKVPKFTRVSVYYPMCHILFLISYSSK